MKTEKMLMWKLSSFTGNFLLYYVSYIDILKFGFVWLNQCVNNINQSNIHSRAEPDLEFEGLLKRQHTRVKYFQGSLMNAMDLERAKVIGKLKVNSNLKSFCVLLIMFSNLQ